LLQFFFWQSYGKGERFMCDFQGYRCYENL